MQYEVYRHKNSSEEQFQDMDLFFKQVEREDKFLCTHAQKNLDAGCYVSGPLHPHNEKGVLHFKSLVKQRLLEHWEKEKELGREITPAKRTSDNDAISEEELFCRDVCASSKEVVAW